MMHLEIHLLSQVETIELLGRCIPMHEGCKLK